MKAAIDEKRRKIEELEGASQKQEGTIAPQVSEIESLKAAKNECKGELKHSTKANEAQERELRQLKDENKSKEDPLMGEVEKLKEEI
jgi:FtsZ-binding cell division protein ZapB